MVLYNSMTVLSEKDFLSLDHIFIWVVTNRLSVGEDRCVTKKMSVHETRLV